MCRCLVTADFSQQLTLLSDLQLSSGAGLSNVYLPSKSPSFDLPAKGFLAPSLYTRAPALPKPFRSI